MKHSSSRLLLLALCVLVVSAAKTRDPKETEADEDDDIDDLEMIEMSEMMSGTGRSRIQKARCGRVVLSPGNIFSPVVRGNYPKRQSCIWKIRAPEDHIVKVEFTLFKVESHKTCQPDFVGLYDGRRLTDELLAKLCGSEPVEQSYPDGPYFSTGRFMTVRFRTNTRIELRGWRAKVTFVQPGSETPCSSDPTVLSPNSQIKYPLTGTYDNDAECRWLIQAPAGKYVQFTLTALDVELVEHCLYDFLELHDGDNPNAVAIGNRFCGDLKNYQASQLVRKSSGSSMFLVFESDESLRLTGFQGQFDVVDTPGEPLCPGTLVELQGDGSITLPPGDNFYVNQMSCEWLFKAPAGKKIKLKLKRLDVEFDAACQYDALNIYDSGSPAEAPKYSLCGKNSSASEYLSSSNKMFIRFFSDSSVTGKGFAMDYETVNGDGGEGEGEGGDIPVYGCSDEFQTISPEGGIIQVPLNGGAYSNNLNCVWTIYAPEGHIIRARFLFLDVAPSQRCVTDRVDIANGERMVRNNLIARVCGQSIPDKDYISTGSVMRIRFFTNAAGVAKGFKLLIQPGLKGNCGSPLISRSSGRIVGGQVAKPHTWPWQVSLRSTSSKGHFCGGSIISSTWIVTAAHCIRAGEENEVLVLAGAHKKEWRSADESHRQIKKIARIIQHPGYTGIGSAPDIALLQLASPLDLDPLSTEGTSHPVCIPDADAKVPDYKPCFTTGWGVTDDGYLGDFLNEVEVPVVPQAVCRRTAYYGPTEIKDFEVCAGYSEGGKDSCQGDSGGPLVCLINGKYELHGITSWGIGCGKVNKPGVYTRVTEVVDWIDRLTT